MYSPYVPRLWGGFGWTRSIRTVSTGTGGFMPFRKTSLNGTRTRFSRFVQYGLISRYSIRLRPATILANHSRSSVVMMTSINTPRGRRDGRPDRLDIRHLADGPDEQWYPRALQCVSLARIRVPALLIYMCRVVELDRSDNCGLRGNHEKVD